MLFRQAFSPPFPNVNDPWVSLGFVAATAKPRSALWDAAINDEAEKRAAAGEEKMLGAAGSPTRISSGDVRLVVPLLLLFRQELLLMVTTTTTIRHFPVRLSSYITLSKLSPLLSS